MPKMTAWLDENCGSDGWAMTPSGMQGVLSLYFADATLASAFVARWCVGSKVETTGGLFQVREDDPASRIGWGCVGYRDCKLNAIRYSHREGEPNHLASVDSIWNDPEGTIMFQQQRSGHLGKPRDASGREARDHRLRVRSPRQTSRRSHGPGMETMIGVGQDRFFRTRSEVILEWKSADYHRAAAARVRGLLAEATTRWLKEHLTQSATGHEQIAAAIERASEPDAAITSP
jgi:hypothetical protein